MMVGGVECMIKEWAKSKPMLFDIYSYFEEGSNAERIERLKAAFKLRGLNIDVNRFEDFLVAKYIRNAYVHGEWNETQRIYVAARGFPNSLMSFEKSHFERIKESYMHVMGCLGRPMHLTRFWKVGWPTMMSNPSPNLSVNRTARKLCLRVPSDFALRRPVTSNVRRERRAMLTDAQRNLIWQIDTTCRKCMEAVSYFNALAGKTLHLWTFTHNCFGEIAAIQWCNVFNKYEDCTHFKQLFGDPTINAIAAEFDLKTSDDGSAQPSL